MTDCYVSPVLFHRGRKGAIYQWRVWSEGSDIVTEYGQIDGQMQISRKRGEAKNVGRANATTPEEQAALEAQAMYTFKIERKYRSSIAECKERRVSPMLAPGKAFAETKKYVTYPCDVQPKLDGCRCLAYWEGDDIVLMSRGGKPWNLPHIVDQLRKVLPEDAMFDGELYIHGETFQAITKLIKSKKAAERERVEYHVYDLPVVNGEEGAPWILRRNMLTAFQESWDVESNVKEIHFFIAHNEDEVISIQAQCVADGYEGAMVRLRDGIYEWGYRSKALLKAKTFDDHEYRIADFTSGRGKNEATVTWVCALEDGRTFNVAPGGKREEREQMLKDGARHVGKLLKVKHFGFSDDGFPRFPVGIGFRLEEDTPVAA
jgi:DNA ligase-1